MINHLSSTLMACAPRLAYAMREELLLQADSRSLEDFLSQLLGTSAGRGFWVWLMNDVVLHHLGGERRVSS